MKNYIFTAVLLFLTISLSAQPIPKYKDASQPIEVRVQDLLSRMTIEEKVAQLRHIHEGSILNDDHTLNLEKMKNIIGTLGWGAVEGLTLEGIGDGSLYLSDSKALYRKYPLGYSNLYYL